LSRQFAATANRRFDFHKRGQLFFASHNEPLSLTAMRISNKDRLSVGIDC